MEEETSPVFTLMSREDCPLCDEMLPVVREACDKAGIRLRIEKLEAADPARPDSEREAGSPERLYGSKVPVLLDADMKEICHGRFDAEVFARAAGRFKDGA